jgi:hypothetical protein
MEYPSNFELRYIRGIDLAKRRISHSASVASVVGPIRIAYGLSQER